MARLPQPGGDAGNWGEILNDYLSQSLEADGTIKPAAISDKANDSAVVHKTSDETVAGIKTFSSSPIVPTPTNNTDAVNKSYVDSTAASATPDADATTKGKLQLTGDLGGTATSPTVPGLVSKADDSTVVHVTGNQTVAGIKTFSSSPVVPTPTNSTDAVSKSYVDSTVSGGYSSHLQRIATTILSAGRNEVNDAIPSADIPTVTNQITSGLAANSHGTPPITSAVMRQPLRVTNQATTVDIVNDPHFYYGACKRTYGTGYPDYFVTQPDMLIGGSSQARRWDDKISCIIGGSSFAVRYKAYQTSSTWRLKVNGHYVSPTTTTISSLTSGSIYDCIFTFPGDAIREIEISGNVVYGFVGIWIEPTGSLHRGGPRFRLVGTGDSHTGGANGVGSNDAWVRIVAEELGMEWVNLGIGGSGYRTTAPTDMLSRVPDAAYAAPDVFIAGGGYNDATISTYQQEYDAAAATFAAYQAALPKTLIIATGSWLAVDTYSTTLDTVNRAIRDAATAAGLPYIEFMDPLYYADANPPNFSSSITYEAGDIIANGSQKHEYVVRGLTGGFTASKVTKASWILGTGRVGATTGAGNADKVVSSDAVHMTAYGHQMKGRYIASEVRRIAKTLLS